MKRNLNRMPLSMLFCIMATLISLSACDSNKPEPPSLTTLVATLGFEVLDPVASRIDGSDLSKTGSNEAMTPEEQAKAAAFVRDLHRFYPETKTMSAEELEAFLTPAVTEVLTSAIGKDKRRGRVLRPA